MFNPIPPRLFSNLFPLGGGRHVSHLVELDTEIFLHQNFSLGGLRVSITLHFRKQKTVNLIPERLQ